MSNKKIPLVIPKLSAFRSLAAFTAGCLFFGGVAQAQPPGNAVRFSFSDVGPGTTMSSDPSLGGASLNLFMVNGVNVPTDYHGTAGSGVSGAVNGNRAMNFSAQTNQPGGSNPNAGTATGTGPVASITNSAALGFGSVTSFVASIWIKQNALMALSGGNVNIGPRLFILNAGAPVDSGGSANGIGMKFQSANQIYLQIGTDTVTVGPALSSNLPTNKWLFIAATYDGTNARLYMGSDTATATLVGTAASANRTINLGASASLAIGNRSGSQARTRSFDGWIDDFRFYTNSGDAAFVESIRQATVGGAPIVTGVYPDGLRLQEATNQLTFTASSPAGSWGPSTNITNVQVVLNGVDVSSHLVTSGPATNLTVSYTGLPQNLPVVTATITVTDAKGLVGTASVTFDTFSPTNFTWEAEEFDFNSGQFIDNPTYTDGSVPTDPNSYFGLDSVEAIDTHKGTGNGGINASDYRVGAIDATRTQTPAATTELPRLKFINNPDTNAVDHMIGNTSNPDWQNYTKTFPPGLYNIYGRFSGGSGGSIPITLARVVSGQGTSGQATTNLGTFTYTSSGTVFQYAPLLDSFGNLAVVNLAGTNTVRATWGSGGQANFYMLVPANTNLPTITQVYPDGVVLFEATNRFVFTTSSGGTINTNSIRLSLNGTDVSSNLVFTGGPSVYNVVYNGLKVNQSYTVLITVTDSNGGTASSSLKIDTYNPILQFEAEDFDFDPNNSPVPNGSGKRYIDNPVPSTNALANSYFGQVGDELIDEFGNNNGNPLNSLPGYSANNYRNGDRIMTSPVTDANRQQFVNAGAGDYNVGFLGNGFWETYTRTFPAGTYNVYGRMASGNGGTIHIRLDQVTAGWGTTGQLTTNVGTFNCPGSGGYAAYLYVPMLDKFGNFANVTLNGTNTFRSTVDNPVNINFYMLLAARTDLPRIDSVYPDGATLLQGGTNKFSFIASGTNGIATSNIVVTLNGTNISSSLVFTGSSNNWTVSYPGLVANTSYTAAISIKDGLGQTAATSVTFDTFSPSNFTWEAEDFDFGGGLFIDNPVPADVDTANSYFDQVSSPGVDENYVTYLGTHLYRPSDYIATEVTSDGPRLRYLAARAAALDPNLQDYDVFDWVNTSTINYTRTYPTGTFHVYARMAGGNGAFNPTLGQVTSGWGTGSQVVQNLGTFKGTGASFTAWQYVELIDTNSQLPVTVTLGGTNTFQAATDGNVNANFYMLVPAAAPSVKLSAMLSGGNILLSFPTQSGATYSVSYKNSLTDATWTTNNTVSGDGTVKTISDGTAQSSRFYRLTIH